MCAVDVEVWLAQQPHLMSEILRIGRRGAEIAAVLVEQLAPAAATATAVSTPVGLSVTSLEAQLPKLAAAAQQVLRAAGVQPISYDYDGSHAAEFGLAAE